MPLTRKILKVGVDSKAVTLPKSWFDNAEQEEGKKIVAVTMEVNGVITIAPVFERKSEELPCQEHSTLPV
ncbi:MAG: hypothetical protein ABSD92_11805 [Candidatus Bathyarchaeia archaeon]|jgi:antitoxin component of MazEF toxin-antitoxin module